MNVSILSYPQISVRTNWEKRLVDLQRVKVTNKEKTNWTEFWLDKLVVAVFLVILSLFGNFKLEKLKTDLSFRSDINKTKIEKLAEVWAKFDLYHSLAEDHIKKTQETIERYTDQPKTAAKEKLFTNLNKEAEALSPVANDLKNTMEKNRFWLDADTYQKINEYVVITDRYFFTKVLNISLPSKEEELKTLTNLRGQKRRELEEIRDKLFGND